MALGFLGMPQDPLGPNINRIQSGGIQSGVQKMGGGSGFGVPPPMAFMGGGGVQSGLQKSNGQTFNGVPPPSGPNFQLGQQGWQVGNGIGLPMSSGDHLPIVTASLSHAPPRSAMAPGQPFVQRGQPGMGQSNAQEPWAQPGWQQPAPTYNDPAWGSGAIGWGGSGNAPQMPAVDPTGLNRAIGTPPPPVATVAAGTGGPNSVGAGMPPGQWQSIIQALSGLGSNIMQTPPPGAGGYTNPNFLNMLLSGLGGYQ